MSKAPRFIVVPGVGQGQVLSQGMAVNFLGQLIDAIPHYRHVKLVGVTAQYRPDKETHPGQGWDWIARATVLVHPPIEKDKLIWPCDTPVVWPVAVETLMEVSRNRPERGKYVCMCWHMIDVIDCGMHVFKLKEQREAYILGQRQAKPDSGTKPI